MKYKFKGSDIKNLINEEIMRYYALKENSILAPQPANMNTENPMQFSVLAQGKGITSPSAELKTSNIEDAAAVAATWVKQGHTLDPKGTSKEILQQLNLQNTMPDQPGVPTDDGPDTDISALSESEELEEMKSDLKLIYQKLIQHLGPEKFLNDFVRVMNPRALRDSLEQMAKLYQISLGEEEVTGEAQPRPRREEFLKQTFELCQKRKPELTYETFSEMEIPNGEHGKVVPQYFYYNTNSMPQQVAELLMQQMLKQEDNIK